jgi:hypothetical protein
MAPVQRPIPSLARRASISLGLPLVEWNFSRADLQGGERGVLNNPGGSIFAS